MYFFCRQAEDNCFHYIWRSVTELTWTCCKACSTSRGGTSNLIFNNKPSWCAGTANESLKAAKRSRDATVVTSLLIISERCRSRRFLPRCKSTVRITVQHAGQATSNVVRSEKLFVAARSERDTCDTRRRLGSKNPGRPGSLSPPSGVLFPLSCVCVAN